MITNMVKTEVQSSTIHKAPQLQSLPGCYASAALATKEDRVDAVMAPFLLFKTKIQLVSRRKVAYRPQF